jgi:N-acetylmuramic acid 6-phosphate etherase
MVAMGKGPFIVRQGKPKVHGLSFKELRHRKPLFTFSGLSIQSAAKGDRGGMVTDGRTGAEKAAEETATEDINPRFADLDAWPLGTAIEAMWEGQMAALAAVRPALPAITAAAEAAAQTLGDGGRLIYAGAGTSGRVAVQDGAELTPTFNWPVERTVFLMAGGDRAFITSIEGAEDDAEMARREISALGLTPSDVVIGVAASGTTPYTVAAVAAAGEAGALTIGIANNAGAPLLAAARFPILVETGSEVIAGSTRMKAGTAQKVVLNLISTAIMLHFGKVYRGMMVNMRASNDKLQKRAVRMVSRLAGCDSRQAADAFARSGGDIRLAILLALGHEPERAATLLRAAQGNLRAAIAGAGKR